MVTPIPISLASVVVAGLICGCAPGAARSQQVRPSADIAGAADENGKALELWNALLALFSKPEVRLSAADIDTNLHPKVVSTIDPRDATATSRHVVDGLTNRFDLIFHDGPGKIWQLRAGWFNASGRFLPVVPVPPDLCITWERIEPALLAAGWVEKRSIYPPLDYTEGNFIGETSILPTADFRKGANFLVIQIEKPSRCLSNINESGPIL